MKSFVTFLSMVTFMVTLSAAGTASPLPPTGGSIPGPDDRPPIGFLSDLRSFEAAFPRTEGSPGERQAFSYLQERIAGMGIETISPIDMERGEGMHSFSRSFEVAVPGSLDDTLIVAVPLNAPPGSTLGRDGSVNLALALGMLERALRETPTVSLRFLFLGAEHGEGPEYPMGTELFLRNFFPEVPVAVLYLDFRNIPSRILSESGGRGIVSPYWLISRYAAAMDASELPFLNLGTEHQIFRLGVESTGTAIERFLQAGYPGISLSDVPDLPPSPEPERWASGFLTFFDEFLRNNRDGFGEEWDRHYLFYQIRSRYLVVSERAYLLIVILILASTLGYGIIFKGRLVRYLRTISRNAWNLPVFLGLIFGFLFLATILVRGIFLIRSFPSLWETWPLPFFALKLTTALFLFSLLFQLVRRLPFSRNGSFYSASALVFLFLDIVMLTGINISFSYYFLWAFFFAFLFSGFRSRWLKLLAFAASPAWLLKATVDIFTLPDLPVGRILLLSPIRGNLLLAFFTLPFLLMLIRLDFLVRHPIRGKRGFAIVLSTSITGLLTVLLAAAGFLHQPYGTGNPQPLEVIERIDLDTDTRILSLRSPAPLGPLSLRYDGEEYRLSGAERSWDSPAASAEAGIELSLRETPFLGRKTVTLSVDAANPSFIGSLEILLTSPDRIVVYDATFPVSLDPAAGTARIHIGRNPPLPLAIQFTVPDSIRLQVRILATGDRIQTPFEIDGNPFAPVYRRQEVRTLSLQ